jgi:hypothetical protein
MDQTRFETFTSYHGVERLQGIGCGHPIEDLLPSGTQRYPQQIKWD